MSGRLDLPAVLSRRDDAGVALGDAMRSAGVDPDGIGEAPGWLEKLAGFIEIHIDQTTEFARAGAPVGVVSALAARTRLEVVLRGRADHAGTTPRSERRDALSAAARLIVGAEDLAGDDPSLTITTSRILAKPNAPTTIAAEVRLWIDARAPEGSRRSTRGALGWTSWPLSCPARSGVEIEFRWPRGATHASSRRSLRAALARASEEVIGHAVPEVVCFAGHDAGVLAERVPAAMLLVRNETGVSHSPAEDVDLADAAVAARVVERALGRSHDDPAVAIPGMPNAHSHAFQRGLRGRAERPGPAGGEDDFWTWRTEMFALAETLDPESMHAVALETYREMAGAGYAVVGEFHYVHHQPDGTPYAEPNAMAHAVAERRVEAGLPIVLLPAAYNRGGWDGEDLPPAQGQRRFCDPDVETFLARVDALRLWSASVPGVEVGIAAHSVRAVPQLARGDRRVLRAPRDRPSRPRPRAAPRARGVPGRARLSRSSCSSGPDSSGRARA